MIPATGLETAISKLLRSMEKENFSGYDPYDGLESPVFRLPFLKTSVKFQFLFQQLVKRSPLNFRKLLGIPKGINPVTIGLALQGYTDLYKSTAENRYLDKCKSMLQQLESLRSSGYNEYCWGYNFRWSSRYALIPAHQPTVVATGIIIHAVYDYWKISQDPKAAGMVCSAAKFVSNTLNRTEDADGLCFSYSPFDREQVLNASMKGARILAEAYSITKEMSSRDLVYKACNWICKKQAEDGSWKYSLSKSGTKTDNYHSGYVLDCLAACIELCDLPEFNASLEKGRHYYLSSFFTENGQPKFYNDQTWPADCTAAGQSILSLCLMNEVEAAEKTAAWTIRHMQSPEGRFYFRKYPAFTEKTFFMRWSDAWMLAALCRLQCTLKSRRNYA